MKEIGEASSKSPGHSEDYQRQTILNLYNSGIEEDIISLQLDISKEYVDNIIEQEIRKKKEQSISDDL